MLLKHFIDEHFDGDFDVILGLEDINAIVHIQISLAFDGYGEAIIDEVHDNVRRVGIGGSNSKLVDLSHK
jgi:hypothetical protein